jgi:ATP/maltotriose-dependent transcriptional regulator MalT
LIARPRLTTWLEQRRSRPLTLVSVPAGYGKHLVGPYASSK